jgi:predicted ABC-type sugar transport system permease subunit
MVVTVDFLVRRTVMSNNVYEILDYVLNARMVSIDIIVYALIYATDGCKNKWGCITSADGYLENSV